MTSTHTPEVLFEDHNHVSSGNHTQHPEFAISQWAANNMEPEVNGNSKCGESHLVLPTALLFYG